MNREVRKYLGEKVEYDEQGTQIWAKTNGVLQHVADVRGWGAIQNMFKTGVEAQEFQDAVGQFIVDAINEKLERDE